VYGSIFPSVQNLLLAARAAGLGATLITLPLWSRFLARRALWLPWSVAPCAVVPLGWPMGRYGSTTRRPVEEVVSLDRYGNRAFRSPYARAGLPRKHDDPCGGLAHLKMPSNRGKQSAMRVFSVARAIRRKIRGRVYSQPDCARAASSR
jgi:hypothetical protein